MKRIFLFTLIMFFVTCSQAQQKHRFSDNIEVIKKYDKIYEPVKDPIVFVGSSSIRKWKNLQEVFGSYNVINRGIGGAVIDDIIYYLNDLVLAYNPRQIVIYVGENDLTNKQYTPTVILDKTKELYRGIRDKLPNTAIVYISLKPSPVRDKYMQKCIEVNNLVKDFLTAQKNVTFIDVFTPMLKDGKSRPELFVGDRLHMNAKGYAIWEKRIRSALIKGR
ncbi:GDSL-type esterase/lipase family protein [Niabella ginsengisoli]|uniref:GDSL-type esterase/lipase family protein n=1 Tax=Niabella ginsengisoli TaxID=522298 RepID=A0ABS9SJ89_9BACT|nr:GDSL-type esterase/lipase family protein [Niabella ginsengisoli]MCH5598412.1 GDSL-type esterase/lipase family protein [Niabella ginsengisoli]